MTKELAVVKKVELLYCVLVVDWRCRNNLLIFHTAFVLRS